MSALDRRSPRFCFRPRSIASCNERDKTPGIGCEGTLPEKFPPCVGGLEAAGADGSDDCVVPAAGAAPPGAYWHQAGVLANAAQKKRADRHFGRKINELPPPAFVWFDDGPFVKDSAN